MDETLVHCVDDYEEDDPDVILEIVFPENDEPVKVRSPFTSYFSLTRLASI